MYIQLFLEATFASRELWDWLWSASVCIWNGNIRLILDYDLPAFTKTSDCVCTFSWSFSETLLFLRSCDSPGVSTDPCWIPHCLPLISHSHRVVPTYPQQDTRNGSLNAAKMAEMSLGNENVGVQRQTDLNYFHRWRIHGLVQERRNSSAIAMELRLSCTNPLVCYLLLYNTHMLYFSYQLKFHIRIQSFMLQVCSTNQM